MSTTPANAIALTAMHDDWLPDLLSAAGYRVHRTTSGLETCELAAEANPDVVILDPLLLDDMSGTDLCRRLHFGTANARNLPILIIFDGAPTPELRVAALRVGAWDFLSPSSGSTEVLLKVASYVEAKRSVGDAVEDGVLDPSSGFRSLPGLARRARELASLMSRVSGAFSCIVIVVEGRDTVRDLGGVAARAARLSDVVGDLGSNRIGVLAPGTDAAGAVRLTKRIADALTTAITARAMAGDGVLNVSIAAGFDVVANARYRPVDPFELLQRAAAAVTAGTPSAEDPWVRRFVEPDIERRTPPVPTGAVSTARPSAGGARS